MLFRSAEDVIVPKVAAFLALDKETNIHDLEEALGVGFLVVNFQESLLSCLSQTFLGYGQLFPGIRTAEPRATTASARSYLGRLGRLS